MIATLISALFLMGLISPENAWAFLYITGFLLIIGELVIGGHGLLVFNSLLAFFAGYTIHAGRSVLMNTPFDWELLFGIAFVELLLLLAFIVVTIRYRRIKASTGSETMIGQKAVVQNWSGKNGTVLIEGENWKAEAEQALELEKNETVTVTAIDGLTLKVRI
jgi:membrane-bound serine protease (ClpP class)